jgi:hypothetical protein
MNCYQLESKEMDQAFLIGEVVICEAALPIESLGTLKEGDKIVIQLSNRSKYMGTIRKLHFAVNGKMATGHMKIVRA